MESLSIHLNVKYRRVLYSLNDSGQYLKEPDRLSFAKLPPYLKVEKTQTDAPKTNGAKTIIHGPQKMGKYIFYTGLRETGLLNWQYGNDFEFRKGIKSNSLVLFNWTDNDRVLKVYYYTGWYHHDRTRLEQIIPRLILMINKDEQGV